LHVTYHDACHLAHTQKITKQPRDIIALLPGLKITPLNESTWCCGSAGIYNVVRYDDALKFLEKKMKNIKDTGAEVVLAGNPGCMGQIQYGSTKFNVDVKVLHPVSLIKLAYKKRTIGS
jgi:glycolate oxidase iron-sulfur subunit